MAGSDEVVVHCSLVNTILVAELVNKNSTVAKKKKTYLAQETSKLMSLTFFATCRLSSIVHHP